MEELHKSVMRIEEFAINEIVDPETLDTVKEDKLKLINMVFSEIKNLDQSRQRYELIKLLFYDKNNYNLFYLIANTFFLENKIKEAKAFYTIAINRNKLFMPPYFGLANIYKISGRKDLSIVLLEHLFRIVSFKDSEIVITQLKNYYDAKSVEKFLLKNIVSNVDKTKSLYNLGLVVVDNDRANRCFNECLESVESEDIKNLIRSKIKTH